MTIGSTHDYALVRAIVTHPAIWPFVTDDYTPAIDSWQPLEHSSLEYVTAYDGEELLGLWMFERRGACWEVHTCMLPCSWRGRAREATSQMLAWLWVYTPCRRLITNVPAYNLRALRFAENAGMTRFGVNERSYLKDGQLHDQILLGLSRPKEN